MKISSDTNCFYIEGINEENLYIKYKDYLLPLMKNKNGFVLSVSEIQNFFEIENTPLHFVNDNGVFVKINQIKSDIFFDDNTYIQNKGATYYIYIDKYDFLTIVYNKRPSLFNFYRNDSNLINIDEKNSSLVFQFSCKYFIPKSVKLHIIIRNSNREETIEASHFNVTKTDKNIYHIKANIKFSFDNIKDLLLNDENIVNYNLESYDFYFSYKINEMPLSAYPPRIKNTDQRINKNNEIWFDFRDSKKCLFNFYSTHKNNLSCRIFTVPNLTYLYYKNLKSNYTNTIKNQKPIILCVEYPEKAQDNSFVFFKYLLSNYNDKFEIYYIVANNSNDINNLLGYEKHILEYQSINHLHIFSIADIILHSHSPNYSLPFFTDFLEEKVNEKKKVFLQHGVIASKDVSKIYGRSKNNKFTDLFVVSSLREKREVIENYNYPEENVILTGLPRFDSIISNRHVPETINNKSILIMPTWRKDQDLLSHNKFKDTDFFKIYNSLLKDNLFIKFCASQNITVNFYLHKNFQKYSNLFCNDYVCIVKEDDTSVRSLLDESKVLITDYSSVALDFSLMYKKVVYFRPQCLISEDMTPDINKLLPGNIVTNSKDLVSELKSLEFDPKFKLNLKNFYKYEDTNACYRIIKELINKFDI